MAAADAGDAANARIQCEASVNREHEKIRKFVATRFARLLRI
jgi:hypothetical protein